MSEKESIGARLARECAQAAQNIEVERQYGFTKARVALKSSLVRARTHLNERNYSDAQKRDIEKLEKAIRALDDIEGAKLEPTT